MAAIVGRRGRDVIGPANRPAGDPLKLRELGGEVEIQDVAGVVAVRQQDAPASRRRLDRLEADVGTGCREDIADRRRVGHAHSHVAKERRLVTGPAANDEANLVGCLLTTSDDPRGGRRHDVAVSADETLEHLVDGVERIVDQLLEHEPTIAPPTVRRSVPRGRRAWS